MNIGPNELLIALLVIVPTAIWISALISALRVPDDTRYRCGTKIIWVLVIVFAGWLGGIIYLCVGRPRSA